MIRRVLALLAVSLVLVGCGVKTDLATPSGTQPAKDQHDPSKPPNPLGR